MKILTSSLFAMLTVNLAAQSLQQQLDAILLGFGAKTPAAHALLIVERGEVLYEGTVGLADLERGLAAAPTTNFRLASITKQFTAAAILMLERQGKLSRQQPVTDFLPVLSPIAEGVTLHHLLNHSSGLPDYENFIPDDRTEQIADADVPALMLKADTTYFAPGTGWRYSNTGYCLLALVVERASGQPFSQFIENQIFVPLGMAQSKVYESGNGIPERAFGYALDERGRTRFSDQSLTSATKGDGGVYTALADFERWATQRGKVLGIDFEKEFNKPESAAQFPISPKLPGCHYGLGWFFVKKPGLPLALFHSGSTCGFSNMVLELPGQQLLVIFLTNLADNNEAFAPIHAALAAAGKLHSDLDIWELYLQTR
jgi:CubicO group peptidase (beta-lactamase class C family)